MLNFTTTTGKIADEYYGFGLGIFNPVYVLWASDKAADVIGVEAAKAELKLINLMREKMGVPVACFEYGHRMF
jgi:hypothetical protein